jgi:alpha-ketoglutarate-dependent taurine dioxygenase
MPSYTSQQYAAWRKSSNEHMRSAVDDARLRQLRIDNAFEAAYFAFIAALAQCDRLLGYGDHPNVKLANAAAAELRLSGPDRELSEGLTHAYYNGDRGKFNLEEILAWARRVREAAWEGQGI